MRKIAILTVAAAALLFAGSPSYSADLGGLTVRQSTRIATTAGCHMVKYCGLTGCSLRQVCQRYCPDGYSCYPLYGAYGPYGGTSYWAAYTETGWGRY